MHHRIADPYSITRGTEKPVVVLVHLFRLSLHIRNSVVVSIEKEPVGRWRGKRGFESLCVFVLAARGSGRNQSYSVRDALWTGSMR